MKLLICGSNGQLGRDCTRLLAPRHEVRDVDVDDLDITRPESVRRMFRQFNPEMVLNCAAYTQVDACETREEEAFRINALGPEHLATAAVETGAWLIHVSTDFVFNGGRSAPAPHVETDPPAPLSAYGRTKLEGERRIRKIAGRFMIVRTAWLYGIDGSNFPKTMLRLALADPERTIRVVNDQFGNPTWSWRLALQLEQLMEHPETGIYHAAGEGFATWFELARRFLTAMQVPHRLEPCTTEEYPTPARRPPNSILENKALKEKGIHVMKDWKTDLDEFVRQHRERLMDEAGQKKRTP